MNAIRLVLSDYDRTFTDETLRLAPGLAEAIMRLKKRDVRFSIISGRKFSFMMDLFTSLDGLVDSFVAENGCVGYACGKKQLISHADGRESILQELDAGGVPFDAGEVVVSVHKRYQAAVDVIVSHHRAFYVVRNVDSLMVLPQGASKESGIRWLMGLYGVSPADMACIGDAENDISMRGVCSLMGAVSNALPELKRESDYVCQASFGSGLMEFLEYIERCRS